MNDSIDFIYDLIKEKGILSLSDCQGSCPCGKLYIRGINIEFHCWRSSCDKDCRYSGLHIRQHYDFNYSRADLEKLGNLCLESIKDVWFNTDWDLVIEDKE